MTGREKLPLAVLVVFWAALYVPRLLAGQTLPARDVSFIQVPWRAVWRDQVLTGTVPLWDPYSNGGRPLFANPNAMAAYPGTLLFLLAPPEVAAAWHLALHHLLLLLGCYQLARRSGATPGPAAVAAAAVGTGGVVWSHLTFLNSQASLAWGFWALATALPPPQPGTPSWRRALGGGSLLGLSFLGGEPITAGFAGLAWATVVLTTWRPNPIARVGAAAAAAAGLSAPVLVPLAAIFPETVRGGLGPAFGALSADALGSRRLVELFCPNLLGPPLADVAAGFWAAPSFPWQRYYPLIFIGVLPLLCLAFAVRAARGLGAWWAIAASGVAGAAILAIPTIADRAQHLIVLGSARYAIKFLILTVLALPPLVAAGWALIVARWHPVGRRALRVAAAVALALAPFAAIPALGLRQLLGALYPASAASLAAVPRPTLRCAALLDWTALTLPPALVTLAGPTAVAAVGATLAANLLGGAGILLWADSERWGERPPALAALPPEPVVAVLGRPKVGESARSPLDRFWMWHEGLLPESGSRWGVAYVLNRGPDGLEPLHQELLARAISHMSLAERARLARAVGANAVIATEALPDWAGRTVGAVWIGSTGAPARAAYLARRTFPADDMLVAATTLASEAFCPGEDAVVEGVGGVQSLGGGSVAGFPGPPHHRRFEVSSTGAGLVVVRQSFMHCWRARVDGRAAAVQPVNGAFCAVRVPDGRHLVEVFLDTTPYWLGAAGPILLGLVAALTRQAGSLRGRGGGSGATVRRNPR